MKAMLPVNVGLTPGFESYVVEEAETYRIAVDATGVKSVSYTDGSSSIPMWLEAGINGMFPIEIAGLAPLAEAPDV